MENNERNRDAASDALERIANLACLALIFLPVGLGFLYVRLYGVNVVYGDQWRIAQLFGKLYSGKLDFADLWQPLNGHRILLPRVVMLLLGHFTKWNNVAEMYATQALLLIVLVILLLAFRRDVGSGPKLLLFVPVAFLVFSFRQAEIMLMGLLMQFALVLVFAVLSFHFLHLLRERRVGKFAFPAALISATLASLSSAQGLLVWPAGLVQLLVGPAERQAKLYLGGIWSFVGTAEWVFYFLNYQARERAGEAIAGELYYPRFFLTLMGSSLSWWPGPALAIGLLLLGLVATALLLVKRDGKLAEHSFFVALMLFAFLVLLAITVERAERGIEQAHVSRYTTYSILGVVGLYGMLAKLYLERGSRVATVAFGALLACVLLSLPVAYTEGIQAGYATEVFREKAARVLATYEFQPDIALRSLYGNPEVVKKRAHLLERLGYNVFSESFHRKARNHRTSEKSPSRNGVEDRRRRRTESSRTSETTKKSLIILGLRIDKYCAGDTAVSIFRTVS